MATYVLTREQVNSAFWNLIDRPIHKNFSGYLCLVWLANQRGTGSNLSWGRSDYVPFFDRFFSTSGGPRPYLKPFCDQTTDPAEDTIWFGSNLPGTYSTATMERSNTGISQVLQVEETGQDSQVSLVDDHVPMAKDELLDSEVISAVSLSTYLYRNFTFEAGDEKEEPPTATDLVDVFKDEFGYEDAEDEFDQLFTTENVDNLFEEYND